jgi:hypothetical protein
MVDIGAAQQNAEYEVFPQEIQVLAAVPDPQAGQVNQAADAVGLHCLNHVPGPGCANFALAAAYGDLAAGILALVTLVAIHLRWRAMIALTWLCTIVGLVDLANALGQVGMVPHFQSAWYIPSFLVPLLLVTHFMVLARLAVRFRKSLKAA